MNDKETCGSAFPFIWYDQDSCGNFVPRDQYYGMTLRQYAAIKLRVPDSGTEWLDDMIRTSLRVSAAEKAMNGILSDPSCIDNSEKISKAAYEIADAMQEAREK